MTDTKTRTDVHSPANFNPENYSYVGAYDNDPDYPRHNDTVRQDLIRLVGSSPSARYGDGFQCDHCGARIRYVGVFKHIPTGDHIAVGQICTDNRFPLSKVDFDRLRKQAQLDREACRIREAWDQFKTDHPHVNWPLLDGSDNPFIKDVLRKGRLYGNLSEKQLGAILHAFERDAARAGREAAEAANPTPTVPVPVGNGIVVTGKLVSRKWKETQFGNVEKMLVIVDTPEGQYKVWGSIPRGLHDLYDKGEVVTAGADIGDTVTFTANVARSSDDEAFGFFQRPRKASVVARATEG